MKFNIYFLTILFVYIICQSQPAKSQIRLAELQNFHTGYIASYVLPSKIGTGYRRVSVELGSPYVALANNAISLGGIQRMMNSNKISIKELDKAYNRMNDKNILYGGYETQLLSVGINIKKRGSRAPIYVGFGIRNKTEMSLAYNRDLFSLLYKGNKQFADQEITLSPNIQLLEYTEYSLIGAYPLQINLFDSLKIKIKPAARIRYLRSGLNINTKSSNSTFYTEPKGQYLDLNFDYLVNAASTIDTPDVNNMNANNLGLNTLLNKTAGTGLGIDLGVSASLNEKIFVHLGLIDIGSIHYKRNTIQYASDKTYRYDGYPVYGFDKDINPSNSLDSLEEFSKPTQSYDPYNVALPTKLIFMLEYKMSKFIFKRMTTYKHNFSLTYVQGFRNYLSSSSKPILDIGYVYSMQNKINAGLHAFIGGHSRYGIGPQVTLKLGQFRVGLLSNNMLGLIYPDRARGIDIGMNLGINF
ncbi:MAG: hypothetical protein KBA06_04770 [Saprospiraceae bacterium]|nr:hypothetical protein [Saprospiraceae bacterium]